MSDNDSTNTTEEDQLARLTYQLVTEGGKTIMEMETLGCAGQEKHA
jgi:hypothetical protein